MVMLSQILYFYVSMCLTLSFFGPISTTFALLEDSFPIYFVVQKDGVNELERSVKIMFKNKEVHRVNE